MVKIKTLKVSVRFGEDEAQSAQRSCASFLPAVLRRHRFVKDGAQTQPEISRPWCGRGDSQAGPQKQSSARKSAS